MVENVLYTNVVQRGKDFDLQKILTPEAGAVSQFYLDVPIWIRRGRCYTFTVTKWNHFIHSIKVWIIAWKLAFLPFVIRNRKIYENYGWIYVNSLRPSDAYMRKLAIGGSDKSLSPGRHQAIILTNAGILLLWSLGTNFSEILIEIHTVSFKIMYLKMSGKWRPFISVSMC